MNCPHCKKPIEDADILQAAASISGKRSRRTLTPAQARAMQKKSAAAKKKPKKTIRKPATPTPGR